MARELKSIVNVERKYIDIAPSGTSTTTGTMWFLSGIAQGLTETSRNGDKVKLQSISFKLLSSYAGSGCILRTILFIDKASSGVVPSASDLLQNVTALGHYNVDYCPSRFQILMDKRKVLNAVNMPFIQESLYKKVLHHLTFKGTSAAQADAATGHMYLFVITDAPATPPVYASEIRITYVDN